MIPPPSSMGPDDVRPEVKQAGIVGKPKKEKTNAKRPAKRKR